MLRASLFSALWTLSFLSAMANESTYDCAPLHEPASPEKELSTLSKLSLTQSWLPQPEPRFHPASASIAWTPSHLYIYVELADIDIFNTTQGLNESANQKGDIVEILLRPTKSDAYFEFQVTPHNQILQLRFPSRQSIADFRQSGGTIESLIASYAVPVPLIETQTWLAPEENRWSVLIKIPASALTDAAQPLSPADSFLLSIGRYDHTRGESEPILSSTSPHPVRDFHRQEEWTRLSLKP